MMELVPSPIIQGLEQAGTMNVPPEMIRAHVAYAIRQRHPQVRNEAVKPDRVCLLGGGPSLETCEPELRELYRAGAKIVTTNGAYKWALDHNYRVSAQIVLDARPTTARFLDPILPECIYLVASQCHPDTWAKVADAPRVGIWHAISEENPEGVLLDTYYGPGRWLGVAGGTTVANRAIVLLRHLGYLRFDLFGVDCCLLDGKHHAFPQPENRFDRYVRVSIAAGEGDPVGPFWASAEHLKSLEDWLLAIRHGGDLFLLNVHGSGLLAAAVRAGAEYAAVRTEDT